MPQLAAKAHSECIDDAVSEVIRQSGLSGFSDLDGLAFTRGPGLSACLSIGLQKVRELATEHDLQTVAVNHMEGHLLAPRFEDESLSLPYLCLLVSGGHSQIVAASSVGDYKLLGETKDIALGDAFDKVARALGLGDINGGRALEKSATKGDPMSFPFPLPMQKHKNCDFSFSGLQTAVDLEIEKQWAIQNNITPSPRTKLTKPASSVSKQEIFLDPSTTSNLAASFQHTCIRHIIHRLKIAIKWSETHGFDTKTLVISGGVACNSRLYNSLLQTFNPLGFRVFRPKPALCRDNAVMIGWAAQENVNVGRNIFSPQQMAEMRYTPRWLLDESKTDYFPDSHPSHASTPITVYRQEALAKSLEALEASFSPQTALKACRSHLTLSNLEECYNILMKAREAFPDDVHLLRLEAKVLPRYTSWRNKYA